MQRLPHQQQFQPDKHGVRELPLKGLSRNDESEPSGSEFPADLRPVPQHHFMVERVVQPQHDQLPFDRAAHRAPAPV